MPHMHQGVYEVLQPLVAIAIKLEADRPVGPAQHMARL